jgi:DNA-binding transcriptional regulator/RsmH inhibitor MraZ
MHTYEFQARVDDGRIEIPAEYKAVIHTPVRVYVITDWENNSKKKNKIPSLGVDMRGFRFDRQEANAR